MDLPIDPHGYAEKHARRLIRVMDQYVAARSDLYVALYTTRVVTSSMMGKTQLIKELAKYLPIVYKLRLE